MNPCVLIQIGKKNPQVEALRQRCEHLDYEQKHCSKDMRPRLLGACEKMKNKGLVDTDVNERVFNDSEGLMK